MLSHVPTWVYGVFVLLLALGLLFTRGRAVHPVATSLTALGFGGYSLYGVVGSFGASSAHILPWAVGMSLSAFPGRSCFGPSGLARATNSPRVLVPGSAWPLALMMGIFAVKFLAGVARATHWPVGTHAAFAPTACLLLGLLSGGFTARALEVRRFVKATAGAP